MHDDPMTDFDPYEWMIDMSNFINELSVKHNQLTNDYAQTKKRLAMLERQLIDIQIQLVAKDFR